MYINPDFQFNENLIKAASEALDKCKAQFEEAEEICNYNAQKVLSAFVKNKVSESHFAATTGYGYSDRGREVLDAVYADIFKAESALVRHFMLSGTHALTVALFGILRPNDVMLSVVGKPYDTLDGVIGIGGKGKGEGTLADFGVIYKQVDLTAEETVDFKALAKALEEKPKMVYIQRSRGYDTRASLTIDVIEQIVKVTREISPESIVFVDNCYGAFVEKREPLEVGADIIIGSLIKNCGGGEALCGGYIAGKHELVELCSYRLTCPGIGGEIGASLGQNMNMFKGIYMAPKIVLEAVKTAIFTSQFYTDLGYACSPKPNEKRTDIVQQVIMNTPVGLIEFCRGIQELSPIDSYAAPEPYDMPGYDSEVIMAAGTFISGSSIELSADGPVRAPYTVYMQGGTQFDNSAIAVINSAQKLIKAGELRL